MHTQLLQMDFAVAEICVAIRAFSSSLHLHHHFRDLRDHSHMRRSKKLLALSTPVRHMQNHATFCFISLPYGASLNPIYCGRHMWIVPLQVHLDMRAYDEEEESRMRLVRKSAAVSSASSCVVVNGGEERRDPVLV